MLRNYILYYSLSPCLPAGLPPTLRRCSERTLLSQRPTVLHKVVILLGCTVLLGRNPPTGLPVEVQILKLKTTMCHIRIVVTYLCPATPKVLVFLSCNVVHSIRRSCVTLHYELCLYFLKDQGIISYNINCTLERRTSPDMSLNIFH